MRIVVERVTVAVGGRVLLKDLDTEFGEKTMTALVGPSGSGKSTLLAVIAGYVSPTSGRIRFDGHDDARQRIALVSQAPVLLMRRTVRDNVAAGGLARGLDMDSAREAADELLDVLDLSHLASVKVYRTSGGERQRVTILRAIAMNAPILLADEPTASLDPLSRAAIVVALRQAAHRGAVVIVATHDPYVAGACDRAISPCVQIAP